MYYSSQWLCPNTVYFPLLFHVSSLSLGFTGLLDQLAEYWGKVAEEFKDFSNILGYELINEPWAGGDIATG